MNTIWTWKDYLKNYFAKFIIFCVACNITLLGLYFGTILGTPFSLGEKIALISWLGISILLNYKALKSLRVWEEL